MTSSTGLLIIGKQVFWESKTVDCIFVKSDGRILTSRIWRTSRTWRTSRIWQTSRIWLHIRDVSNKRVYTKIQWSENKLRIALALVLLRRRVLLRWWVLLHTSGWSRPILDIYSLILKPFSYSFTVLITTTKRRSQSSTGSTTLTGVYYFDGGLLLGLVHFDGSTSTAYFDDLLVKGKQE